MKRLKLWFMAILALVAIVLPIFFVVGVAAFIPPQYDKSFVGALDEKIDRLNSIDEEKIIIVGGSSVAFGIDSELIEEQTGMPVVNFGLYAALGTKVMLDLSRQGVKDGDVVIIAPEMDAQTLSMYFNAETTLQAADGDLSILSQVRGENILSLIGGSWKYLVNKFSYFFNGNAPDPEGVYNADSFNEYGDIDYPRENNIMGLYYDPSIMIDLNESIVDDEFVDYLNEYIRYCERQGAEVYFSFCPMNESALVEGTTEDSIAEFYDYLDEVLDCEIISDPATYIMDAGYFYDTNFHLNDAGVIYRSVKLVEDIFFALGITDAVTVTVPEAPELPAFDARYFAVDENEKYFTYEPVTAPNGNILGYKITGLTEEGKKQKTLTVPLGAETYKITRIGDNAFAGGVATKVVIQDITIAGTAQLGIDDLAFKGSTVRELHIYTFAEETIVPPAGANIPIGFKVYVPEGSYYSTGYYWSQLSVTFYPIED